MALAPEEVGARIEEQRKRLGWTHQRLADEMKVGLRTAQRWQKGRNPKNEKSWLPRLATLMELADRMGVERSYFVEDSGDRFSRLEELASESAERLRRIEDLLQGLPRSRRASG